MTGTAQPLVGRDSEMHLLDRRLGEARGGQPRFVVLDGEPGIGKTSLLAEIGRRAAEQGCLVLDGRATELEQELPFGLIVDALDAYLESLEARVVDRLPPEQLGELAAIFPSLRSLAPAPAHATTAAERFRAHHAVRELLERLAVRQPIVLSFDDVHWSDDASVELLGHLLRRPPDAAVLVLVAHRTGRAASMLAGAIEAAAREGRVERLRLGPLAPGDSERLLDGAARRDRERLLRESGGNPFYLLQLARASDGTDAGERPHGRDADGVPAAVLAAIAAELDVLSEPVRRFAEAAAVTGDPFDVDVAVAAAAMPEHEALDAVDALIERDLVRTDEVPRRFRFRHPLVRSAVYGACSPGTRLMAHERAAEALAERGAPAAARAHHVEQSARHGDLAAVEVLREAGAEAASRAPSSAARWLGAALRILPPSAGPAARIELLMPLSIALAATGRLQEARAALIETLALDVEAPSIPRVAVISACANLEQLLGRNREAHDRLVSALEAEPDRESASAVALMVALALDGFLAMDFPAMVAWAERAVAAAEALDHRPLDAAAMAMLAFARANAGPIDAAREHTTRAAALVDAMEDDELALRIDAISHLAGAEYLIERLDDCIAHGRRGLAVAAASGQGDFFPTITSALSGALWLSGRLDEAAEQLDAGIEAARLSDNAIALGLALLNRAYTTMMQGELEASLRVAEEAVDVTSVLPGTVTRTWAHAVHAVLLYEGGQYERAIAVLREAGGPQLERVPGGMRAVFLEVVVGSLLALGRDAEAAESAAVAQAAAQRFGLRFAHASALRSQAAVALAAGDAPTAAELARTSVAEADAIGARIEAARSRMLAAQTVAQCGDADGAADLLARAAADFDTCGAPRHRDMAERELRKLGRAVHRRTRPGRADATGVAALTGRELEIARLVVDRRTNPEIAGELFLSIKTVESHMRNIFRKLDVTSRVEVARVLEREAAGGPGARR